MSTARIIPFEESGIRVKIRDNEVGGEEGVFYSDEEPHFLKPELGFGFNPLMLGDHLDNINPRSTTYVVVRKLGYGGTSSVWLARRVSCVGSKHIQFFSIKVLTVNMTAGILHDKHWERSSMKQITNANRDHAGYQHCLTLRDEFCCTSYHGPHACFVTEVLGSDLQSLRSTQPNHAFSVSITKRIIKQVLHALEYVHRECGLVHRDVKPQNIMVSMEASDVMIAEYLDKNPATTYEPRVEPDLSPNPIITVRSQPLPNFGLDSTLSKLRVKLADYGESIPIEKISREYECQPVLLRAPEVILGYDWSTPIDIWSVGCLVFEFLTGAALFRLYESESVTLSDVHLERVIELIGDFPPSFLARCRKRDDYFNVEGKLLRITTLFPRTIAECVANYKHVDSKDVGPAAKFILRCLTIDPSARPSASELLLDEWLSDV
ncbi:kinase-like protein [Rickenella mellea]|uniref:non-specific serine/threonine protein kinase n=1 Tax=Rickenella mellea TaxID=50990 RepID=A0A4Y7QBV4_9AGAM|nr:kinase-like protein [Rickenella mellea]